MKKLFFVSLFGLLLAACGGGDGDPDNKPKPDPDEPTRDTEQVWRTKALNAVAELEDIAEKTNEILEEMEIKFDFYLRDITMFDIDAYLYDDLYLREDYTNIEKGLDSWSGSYNIENYPLTREQTYNQVIELYDICNGLFNQTIVLAEYWPLLTLSYDTLDQYIEYNDILLAQIIEDVNSIEYSL